MTALCGIGHVGSSVALGTIGIALGLAVAGLKAVESFRGELLSAFGLSRLPIHSLTRYSHALAGLVVLACGVAMKLGL